MTQGRRELLFGAIGLAIIGVVAYVLYTTASGAPGPSTAQVPNAGGTARSALMTTSPPPPPSPTPTATTTPTPSPNPQTYVVQPGDILLAIAERFNITVDDLVAKNDIKDPNDIRAGQKLVLPQPGERVGPKPSEEDKTIYVVKAGDSLYSISQLLDVSVEDLATLNEITQPQQLFVGRRMKIPPKRLTPPTARPTPA